MVPSGRSANRLGLWNATVNGFRTVRSPTFCSRTTSTVTESAFLMKSAARLRTLSAVGASPSARAVPGQARADAAHRERSRYEPT